MCVLVETEKREEKVSSVMGVSEESRDMRLTETT